MVLWVGDRVSPFQEGRGSLPALVLCRCQSHLPSALSWGMSLHISVSEGFPRNSVPHTLNKTSKSETWEWPRLPPDVSPEALQVMLTDLESD